MATILGSGVMTEQPAEWGFDPDKGYDSARSWKGPAWAVDSITATLQASGYKFRVRNLHGGLAQIDAQISGYVEGETGGGGTVADVVDTWELAPNSVMKPILQADATIINALDATELAQLTAYIKSPPPEEQTPAWTTAQLAVLKLIDAGIESWEIEQPILRHTYNIPRGVLYPFTWSNIWKIHTTAQLITNEGVPADYVLDLAAIGALFTNPTRGNAVSLAYGWRKKMPHQSIGVNGKREVSIEYHFGLWATALYATV